MDIIRNKFLIYPVAVVLIAFLLDKVWLSERFQTYFSKTMSELNYMHKDELYEELKTYLSVQDRRKVLVYFGTSRALLFEIDYVESKYKDWTLFNFSVPGGTPDYSLYWIERFERDNVKPDFVLLDQSIEAYNSSAAISLDDVLSNGLTIPFVLRHSENYSNNQISTLLAKRLFKTYYYRPQLTTFLQRIQNDYAILKLYRELRASLMNKLREGKGSAKTPGSAGGVMPEERLKQSSWGDFHSYLVPFRINKSPMYFLSRSYQILDSMKVNHAAIWVRLSRPYFSLIKNHFVSVSSDREEKLYDYWFPQIIQFQNKHGVDLWNMNEDENYSCDLFSDSGHMAPACFKDYTDYIFGKLQKTNFKNKDTN